MPHEQLDANRLEVFPLAQRKNFTDIRREAVDPDAAPLDPGSSAGGIDHLAERVIDARRRSASVMMAYGAHAIKNSLALVINALVEEGWITHLATQGAGVIHDWEFAFQGLSGESVRDNTPTGRFGAWDETGRAINLAAIAGSAEGLGLGESLGRFVYDDGWTLPGIDELTRWICEEPGHPLTAARADLLQTMQRFELAAGPFRMKHRYTEYSVAAAAHRLGVPLTVHPGIGYDIYTNHPLFHGGAIGRSAGIDARIFARSVENLTGGVYISLGSAIMSPQVFEKALSSANNVRRREGNPSIADHYIAIVDIQDGGDWDWTRGEPPKDHPAYYLRFCKSFYRMGGTADYVMADNRVVLTNLLAKLRLSSGGM